MTSRPAPGRRDATGTWRFPPPGPLIQQAYHDLDLAADLTSRQLATLGDLTDTPRPWDPPSCSDPSLEHQLCEWLHAVVAWHNHEYVWDANTAIPNCWPDHPHLVHELAVLADQRYQAQCAFSSDLLEDWHRYSLPAFIERMHARLKDHCGEGHQPWPARARYARYLADVNPVDR